MYDDSTPPDPLLRAIDECRAQVDRLIDEQTALVAGLEAEWPAAPAAPASEPEPRPRRPAEPPRPPPGAEPPAAPDDPRLRLDALAKHLDRKLRHAGGTPT